MPQTIRELTGVQPSKYTAKDSVLIIIDAQNEYATGHLATHNVTSTRRAIHAQLTRFRHARRPIIHVLHDSPAGAPIFTPGTPLALEFEELTPEDGESVVRKEHPGSFTDTPLADILASLATGDNKPTLVLVGYMAHVCVSTTARQASERGYDVVLPREAIGDRDIPGVKAEDLVQTVLAELADSFGTVVSVHDFVE